MSYVCVIIGTIYTNISVDRYIISPLTRQFMLNSFLYVNFYLEGVFVNNPYKGVMNGSLWTLPIEVISYIIVLALVAKRGIKIQIFILLCSVIITHAGAEFLEERKQDYIIYATSIKYCLKLNVFFLCGCLIKAICNNSSVLMLKMPYWILLIFILWWINKIAVYEPIVILMYAIIIINVGNSKIFEKIVPLRIKNHLLNNDYSYGMYLYAFPVQQIMIQYVPDNWIIYVSSTIIITSILAWVSWTYIEREPVKWAKTLA
ncbi:unannotated protein [freshwater metagenome]|uniref:Unannotated protein n=1 Tax=freshwater metagenome TaxID=449393 RepID=A0A6J7RXY5_9ZZZZ